MAKKILIVDDDVDICKTSKDILTEKGYQVKTINYGYLAIVEIGNVDYDLIFMDIKLAGINGIQTYKEIKKIKPDIKVVIMTGHSDSEVGGLIEDGKKHGIIDENLRKPVNPEEMLMIIKKLIK